MNSKLFLSSRICIVTRVVFGAALLCVLPTSAIADTSIPVDALPQPLIDTEECVNVNLNGWGWDGTRSCFPSNTRFYGATSPLSKTSGDYTGGSLVWNESDVSGKTIRCDNYRYERFATDGSAPSYVKDSLDITFVNKDTEVLDPGPIDFSEATAHLYSRGWRIGTYGRLQTRLSVNFNSDGYSTESGYILVDDRVDENGEKMVRSFSHCYLDDSEPLRATDYCIDFTGDGIGWNGRETCAVSPDPACDYSNAEFSLGWGYNPETGQSCPPAPGSSSFVTKDVCIATIFEGWGWNWAREESCRI